ncbi:MAG TPA: DUF1573 domain-containing protein [Bacteroidia bacterium]
MRLQILLLIMLTGSQVKAQKYKTVDHKNLGTLPSGAVDTQYFYIYDFKHKMTNFGFRSGCGCVSLLLDTSKKSDISHTIQFIYNSSGNVGPLNRYGIVYFEEDSVKDSIKLMISAHVIQTHLNKIDLQNSYLNAIVFETKFHTFYSIQEGENITATYKFTNRSSVPLSIINAESSCGCCFPTYSKEPVKPGDTGMVKVHFNSSGKQGINEKTVSIIFSNGQRVELRIRVIVIEKAKDTNDYPIRINGRR